MTGMPPSRMPAVYPIDSLHVSSLRGLRDITLADLGRVNLFVGGTNSGKTTVLEAISLTGDPLNPLTWSRAANRREPSRFTSIGSSTVDRLKVLFPSRGEEPAPIEIGLTGTSPWEHISSCVRVLRELRRGQESLFDDPHEPRAEEERDGLEVTVKLETAWQTLEEGMRVALFQIVRELLFNVVKHAGVDEATVLLAQADEMVTMSINDDGRGFDAEHPPVIGGQGLRQVKQRVELYGGRLSLESAPGSSSGPA